MKKIILSLGLLMGAFGVANAQDTRFGIKAGVNYATASGDNTSDYKSVAGASAGVMADFGLSDLISFHPELLYSQKGAKLEAGNASIKARTSYLDLPLLVRVNADGLLFEAGPQAGYLLGQKTEYTNYPITGSNGSSTSTEGSRKLDFGYVVGVGYQLEQGLEFNLRYNGGISDLSDPSTAGDKQRNSVFQFQVGYLFGGK